MHLLSLFSFENALRQAFPPVGEERYLGLMKGHICLFITAARASRANRLRLAEVGCVRRPSRTNTETPPRDILACPLTCHSSPKSTCPHGLRAWRATPFLLSGEAQSRFSPDATGYSVNMAGLP